jgi:HlyD family secretion protein
MRNECRHVLLSVTMLMAMAGCSASTEYKLLGTLEWDRISVPAEVSEPVLKLAVAEGAQVKAGDLLLTLDTRRMDARLAQAQATVAQQRARLSELLHGTRVEQLDASRAAVVSAQASVTEADKQYSRLAELAAKQYVARSMLDSARATRDRAVAQAAAAQAQLRELTRGTRSEEIEQAQAAVAAAQSAFEELRLSRARLEVRAPRAGRVDALPFKAGDQPPLGASLASLLVGDAPYARLFIPSSTRVGIHEGQEFLLHIQGSEREWHGRLRSVAREPAFTPYYALTGDDASRLVYRAEVVLSDAEARSLPAGEPLQARLAK